MDVLSHKDYCLAKYREHDVSYLINRKLLIHRQLEKPARTYVVYSDLHGSYDKYLHWLKNGLGYYRIAVSEIIGASYAKNIYECYERLLLIVNRTRLNFVDRFVEGEIEKYNPTDYFNEPVPKEFVKTLTDLEAYGLTKKRILNDVLELLRCITRGDEHRIIKSSPSMFLDNILRLYFEENKSSFESLVQGIVENEKVYHLMISIVVKLALLNMFDKHINLGDTFDRGDGADKLIKFYKTYFDPENNAPLLHYLWGNHDILWMGASTGNPVLCVTALRISMRYNNVDFLFRYGFSLNKLKSFALSCYKEMPTGDYGKAKDFSRWPKDVATKMTKALLVLEAKLTVSQIKEAMAIPGDIDYREAYEHYSALLKMIPTNIPENITAWDNYKKEHPLYTDVYFPTVDPKCPEKLTTEEKEVIDDIVNQFTSLPGLQSDMKWLFEKGEMYRVVDNTLYYHAAIPATDSMELATVKGTSGKKLFDFIQRDLKRISDKMIKGESVTIREKMFLWFLWCGNDSPFFCKTKMATVERAIFNKEIASKNPTTTWKEETNPYYNHIRNDVFLNKILLEFHVDKVCMGHTPVKNIQQGILSENLPAFIIDGGASSAYGDRGAVLINTPDYTYITFHPSLEELKKAESENRLPDLVTSPLEERKNLKLRHMDKGYFLKNELDAINELIAQKIGRYYEDYFC